MCTLSGPAQGQWEGSGFNETAAWRIEDFGDGTQDFGRQMLEMKEGCPWHRSISRSVSGKDRGD